MAKGQNFFAIDLVGSEEAGFQPGSIIKGNVTLDLPKSKPCKVLRIVLSGQVSIQSHPSGEVLFDNMIVQLWGTGEAWQFMPEGKHNFPFTFQLPSNIPSSYEGSHGHIRYTLTASFVRSAVGKPDYIIKKIINVKGKVNASTTKLTQQVKSTSEKTSCCICCTGTSILSVSLDRGGYYSGDTIYIEENHTNRRVTNVYADLRRKTDYGTRRENPDCEYRTIASVKIQNGQAQLLIPSTVPSITDCRILQVSYVLAVTLKFSLPCVKSLQVLLPLVIGSGKMQSAYHEANSDPSPPPYPVRPSAYNPCFDPSQDY